MTTPRLLIVDDEPKIRDFFVRFFSSEGWVVAEAEDGVSAQDILSKGPVDVLVTDLKMPRMDGITLMKWVNEHFPGIQKIVLTAFGSVNAAISAVHEGAYDFISKPIENFEKLKITVQRAYDTKKLREENAVLIDELQGKNKELTERLSELQVAYDLMKEQSRALKEDLATAQKIQFHLLPRHFPKIDKISFAAFSQPSRSVGGDIFDVVQVGRDNIVAYVADASGHGVSSAMMAVFVKQLVRPFEVGKERQFVISPSEVLSFLNNMIFGEGVQDTVFVTMAYVHIDLRNMSINLSTAGHPPIIIRRQDGSVEQIGCHCPALGISREAEFSEKTTNVSDDDIVLMYTDGITDCENESGQQFGRKGLIEAVRSANKSASDVYNCIVKNLNGYSASRPQDDDMSMVFCAFTDEQIRATQLSMPFEDSEREEVELLPQNYVLHKEEEDKVYFLVRGKGTWKESRPLLKSVREAVAGNIAAVIIDLSDCQYLDSTFLGTLQQITEAVEEKRDTELVIQNVGNDILDALDELVMENVMGRITSQPLPLPRTMKKISVDAVDKKQYAGHILETHELLSRLSEKNREKFQMLIESLRKSAHERSSSKE